MNRTRRYPWPKLPIVAAALFIAGCAATPQHREVEEVRICSAADCDTAAHQYSSEQLLDGLRKLLKANEGERVTICDSDPKTHACESIGTCHFVMGGILPGNGCSKSIAFTGIEVSDNTAQLNLEANMPLSFIWTPVQCPSLTGTLSVRSADDISFEFQPRTCSWMVIGVFRDTFKFAVESIDLVYGKVGGYYSEVEVGTAWGKASGYIVLTFPKTRSNQP